MAEVDVTRIAGNIGAMNALNSLTGINKQLAIHQTRLATGKRINSAADDPAGLTIATKMMSRSEGLKVALNNIGDAKNLLAVAESGMGRINDILVQMRNKAETAASDTMGTEERSAINTQLQAYAEQINDIANQTKWNNKTLIDGSITSGSELRFQTGADSSDATSLSSITDMRATGLGVATSLATSQGSVGAGAGFTVGAVSATNSGLSELSTGTYKVVSSFTGSATAGDRRLNVALQDSSGNNIAVADLAHAGFQTNAMQSIAWDGTGTKAVDFGNGLNISFATITDPTANVAVSTNEVTYAKAGTLSLTVPTSGVGGESTGQDYADFMDTVQTALNTVNEEMSKLGALTGRLTFKEDQVSAAQINTEAAYNRIMNANMAEEQVNASKFQILQQTATAMLAQANAAPQFLLSLFR